MYTQHLYILQFSTKPLVCTFSIPKTKRKTGEKDGLTGSALSNTIARILQYHKNYKAGRVLNYFCCQA